MWLWGLERFCGWAEGGAWPEQNQRWMERERGRRPGPTGRTGARSKAGRSGIAMWRLSEAGPSFPPPI